MYSQNQQPDFRTQGMTYPVFTQPVSQEMVAEETPFPYVYTSDGNNYTNESFQWIPSSTPADRMPPGPPPGPSHPWDYRMRQLERQQNQMQREINQLDRRLRTVERRLSIPAPPGPFYGTNP